jgi:hypothetical protein
MSEAHDAPEGGAESFEQEFEAARLASEGPGDLRADGAQGDEEGPEGEGAEGEKAGAERPPLSTEEIQKRWNDQKAATRQERERRRQAEQRAQEVEARLAEIERRMVAGEPEKAAGGRPDPEEDPVGYLQYVESLLATAEQQREKQAEQQAEQRERAQAVQAIVSRVEEFENDFRDTTPDYDAAVEHLYAAKKAEYTDTGYTDDEAHNLVMSEFLARAKRAFDAGKDPAEIVYTLAKRAGYAAQGGAAKLDAIERGQKAANPLAGAGGAQSGELNMEAISNLKGAAFDRAFEKLAERARRLERELGA